MKRHKPLQKATEALLEIGVLRSESKSPQPPELIAVASELRHDQWCLSDSKGRRSPNGSCIVSLECNCITRVWQSLHGQVVPTLRTRALTAAQNTTFDSSRFELHTPTNTIT